MLRPVFSRLAVRSVLALAIDIFCVDPEAGAVVESSAITGGGFNAVEVADGADKESALRLPGILGDDVDDAVHGVGAPQGGAGTANDLDAVDVLQEGVLAIPE